MWSNHPSPAQQIEVYGHPLSFFCEETAARTDVVGKRTRGTKYTVVGFKFRNVLESRAGGSQTLEATINNFVHDVLFNRLGIDLSAKRVTLVMFHSALSAEDPLFVNLGVQTNPGSAVLSFIERFAQSGKIIKSSDPISFDFWIAQ